MRALKFLLIGLGVLVMAEIFLPYPRPERGDLDELMFREMVNGTFTEAVYRSIGNNEPPFARYEDPGNAVLDRLAKGDRTPYAIDTQNERMDIAKIKETILQPYYVEAGIGGPEIVYAPLNLYNYMEFVDDRMHNSAYEYQPAGYYCDGKYALALYAYRPAGSNDGYTRMCWKDLVSGKESFSNIPAFRIEAFRIARQNSKAVLVTYRGGDFEFDTLGVNYPQDILYGGGWASVQYRDKSVLLNVSSGKRLEVPVAISPRFYFGGRLYAGRYVVDTRRGRVKDVGGTKLADTFTLTMYDFGRMSGFDGWGYNMKKNGALTPKPKHPDGVTLYMYPGWGDLAYEYGTRKLYHTFDFVNWQDLGTSERVYLRCHGNFGRRGGRRVVGVVTLGGSSTHKGTLLLERR